MVKISLRYQRLLLSLLLIVLLLFSFTGELVPYNEGLGWDGVIYYEIIRDFDKLIFNHGIDTYHMNRFLPFAIIHYGLSLFNIPINVPNALLGAKILNALVLLLLLHYFFRISNLLRWTQSVELIAFSFVFFNFPVLKLFGYYPILCDCSALLLSYAGIYYYLKKSIVGEIFIGLLGLVTWPILSAILFVLALFPRTEVKMARTNDHVQIKISWIIRLFYIVPPLLWALYGILLFLRHPGIDLIHYLCANRGSVSVYFVYLSLLTTSLFYIISTRVLVVDWHYIWVCILNKKVLLKLFLSGCLFYFIYSSIQSMGGEKFFFTLSQQMLILLKYSSSDPLIFLETHFLYLGLFFVILLLCWKSVVMHVCKNYGIGYFFALLIALIFVLEIETRKLESFYPILLIPLMGHLSTIKLKKSVIAIIPFICLILSFFWFQINVPGIAESFNQPYETYFDFPAQRYFMFFGLGQSHIVYLLSFIVEIILTLSVVLLYKRGILSNTN